MSEHSARITWKRDTEDFAHDTYSRKHTWTTEPGFDVPFSAAKEFLGDADCTNPEEALVAALSSCHMLTFLALAARKRLVVNAYEDQPVGTLDKRADGKMAVTRIVLRPKVQFEGAAPSGEQVAAMHQKAHEHCFIGNSFAGEVSIES